MQNYNKIPLKANTISGGFLDRKSKGLEWASRVVFLLHIPAVQGPWGDCSTRILYIYTTGNPPLMILGHCPGLTLRTKNKASHTFWS